MTSCWQTNPPGQSKSEAHSPLLLGGTQKPPPKHGAQFASPAMQGAHITSAWQRQSAGQSRSLAQAEPLGGMQTRSTRQAS